MLKRSDYDISINIMTSSIFIDLKPRRTYFSISLYKYYYSLYSLGSITEENGLRPSSLQLEINLTLEIGQLLLSLLHAWGLDKDLDKVALTKLGLLKPR